MIKAHAAFIALALLATPTVAVAETPEEKGLALIVEADKRDQGWGDATADMKMILKNKQGQESVREIRSRSLEVEGDGDKTLSIFDTPKDVKGTAFLTFTHKTGDDDQWLYLPALKRVKRISSRNKSGSFMGSEFAYEDIASQEVEKYTYRWIEDTTLDGKPVHIVEQYPVDKKNSGYSRQRVWLDTERFIPLKTEFYDRKNALMKTLVFHDYKEYLGAFWRADVLSVVNHQNGKSTDLIFSNYAFGTGLTDDDFNQNSLKRAR